MLLSALLFGYVTGCADEPQYDDLPGPPQPFDGQRFAGMAAGTMKSYLQLQDALAHDEFIAARAAAVTLADLATGDLTAIAGVAADAVDIGVLRAAFRPLSEMLIGRNVPAGMAVAYCPMAFNFEGGRWLQLEGDISNPYYGASMLRCGAFEQEADTPVTPDES